MSKTSAIKRVLVPVGDPIPLPPRKTSATAEARTKQGHSYKPLPKEFRHRGFQCRQIAREGDVALYEGKWLGCAEPSPSWEVIRIRRREAFQIDGRFVDPAEVYPASELWGIDAFTFPNRDRAWARFFEISREEQQEKERG